MPRYRTEAHATIRKWLGVNLLYTDALGDTFTIVTKKLEKASRGLDSHMRHQGPISQLESDMHIVRATTESAKQHGYTSGSSTRALRASMLHAHTHMPQWGDVARRLPTQGIHLMLDFQRQRQQRYQSIILGQPPRDLRHALRHRCRAD